MVHGQRQEVRVTANGYQCCSNHDVRGQIERPQDLPGGQLKGAGLPLRLKQPAHVQDLKRELPALEHVRHGRPCLGNAREGVAKLIGEFEFAAPLVERFTAFHRRSYVCKTGLGDVLIGAAAEAASHNGVEGVSHIKDKLVEMTHLNETIYGTGVAASYQATAMPSGVPARPPDPA
mgnify:CR=1 FL=1